MSEFERQLPSYRLVEIHYGDDLQAIASREMGDANRWPELVWLNALVWPYITDDEARAGTGVLLSGQFIKIPAPAGVLSDRAETGQVFERDCKMTDRMLADDGAGDFQVVSGSSNLVQQLQHRIITPRGQAMRHPTYGSLLYRVSGRVNGPAASLLAAEYTKAAVLSDYRIRSVESSDAKVTGDAVAVTARATTIAGGVVDLQIE